MKYRIEAADNHEEELTWAKVDECDSVEAFYRRCGASDLSWRLVRKVDDKVLIHLDVFDDQDGLDEGFIDSSWGETTIPAETKTSR